MLDYLNYFTKKLKKKRS